MTAGTYCRQKETFRQGKVNRLEIAYTLLRQTASMFLLMGVGYWLFKSKKISVEGSKSIGAVLINIVLPAVILNSFFVERTPERIEGLLLSAVGAAVILTVCILCARVSFRHDPIAHFAAAFSNPGFFGIPLVTAAIGSHAVFYLAAFVALLNLLQWSYGVCVMTGEKSRLKPAAILKAPFMIAILLGLFFFITQIPLPGVITQAIGYVKDLNTPLSMFTVGVYLAQTDLRKIFTKTKLYLVSLVRLIVCPAFTIALLCIVPEQFHDLKLTLLVAAACPVGSNVAIYAQLHHKDYTYAVETVILSTILSVVTIPLMVLLSGAVW